MKCAVDTTIRYAKFLAQRVGCCEPFCMASVALMDLGIPVNFDGFVYARDIILLRYHNRLITLSEAYQVVTEKYAARPNDEQIYASIHNAIKEAWKHRDEEIWRRYFPVLMSEKAKKPSNTELICGLVLFMEMWYDCAVAYERNGEEAGYGNE